MFTLTPTDKETILSIARNSLNSAFDSSATQKSATLSDILKEPHPCFVTLLTKGNGRLRGCIGCMETETPLHENVFIFARKAAFEDPRFQKVSQEEVPNLRIEVSVLGPMEDLPSLDTLEIGRHGLHVEQGWNHGVLLAKVATEFGWDKKKFLQETCAKADLDPSQSDSYKVSYFEEISFGE